MLGCHNDPLATLGTPLGGTTLLHMCIDYDEMEIAQWLIARGIEVDIKAAIDVDGFGGHTALAVPLLELHGFLKLFYSFTSAFG
jgi:hypothetical protein